MNEYNKTTCVLNISHRSRFLSNIEYDEFTSTYSKFLTRNKLNTVQRIGFLHGKKNILLSELRNIYNEISKIVNAREAPVPIISNPHLNELSDDLISYISSYLDLYSCEKLAIVNLNICIISRTKPWYRNVVFHHYYSYGNIYAPGTNLALRDEYIDRFRCAESVELDIKNLSIQLLQSLPKVKHLTLNGMNCNSLVSTAVDFISTQFICPIKSINFVNTSNLSLLLKIMNKMNIDMTRMKQICFYNCPLLVEENSNINDLYNQLLQKLLIDYSTNTNVICYERSHLPALNIGEEIITQFINNPPNVFSAKLKHLHSFKYNATDSGPNGNIFDIIANKIITSLKYFENVNDIHFHSNNISDAICKHFGDILFYHEALKLVCITMPVTPNNAWNTNLSQIDSKKIIHLKHINIIIPTDKNTNKSALELHTLFIHKILTTKSITSLTVVFELHDSVYQQNSTCNRGIKNYVHLIREIERVLNHIVTAESNRKPLKVKLVLRSIHVFTPKPKCCVPAKDIKEIEQLTTTLIMTFFSKFHYGLLSFLYTYNHINKYISFSTDFINRLKYMFDVRTGEYNNLDRINSGKYSINYNYHCLQFRMEKKTNNEPPPTLESCSKCCNTFIAQKEMTKQCTVFD